MNVDEKWVHQVAGLAKLKIEEDQVDHYVRHLRQVLDYFETLKKAARDLPNEGESDEPAACAMFEREDQIPDQTNESANESITDELLKNAPQVAGSSFQVPRIID